MRRPGLREELLGGAGAVALAGLLLLAWLILRGAESAILAESRAGAERDAEALARAVREAWDAPEEARVRALAGVAHRFAGEGRFRAIEIRGPEGAVVAAFGSLGETAGVPPLSRAVSAAEGTLAVLAEPEGGETLARIDRLRLVAFAFTGSVVLVVVGIGRAALGRAVIGPVEDLAAAARRIAAGDYAARAGIARPDEIGALGRAFDEMAAGLERSRRELLHAEKLAAAGRLAAGVAHEIGNPLAAIRGNLQLLREGGLSEDERRRVHGGMDRAAERIDRIVSALLDCARPAKAERAPADPRAAVEGALELLRAQPRLAGVRFTADAEGAGAFETDARLLVQILVNLLANAAQAAGPGGNVRVRARWGWGEDLVVEVEDDGPGVPEAEAERIFDPFYTTKPAGEGTGLGLAVARRIADDLGGELALARAGAGGAVFRLTIPGPAAQRVAA